MLISGHGITRVDKLVEHSNYGIVDCKLCLVTVLIELSIFDCFTRVYILRQSLQFIWEPNDSTLMKGTTSTGMGRTLILF